MRRLDWIVVIVLIIGAIASKLADFGSKVPDTANPRRPSVQHFSPDLWDDETEIWLSEGPARQKFSRFAGNLPNEALIEDNSEHKSSVGSAFSVSRKGVWLTARHVAEGCTKTAIQTGRKKYVKIKKVILHPEADVAILLTNGGPKELKLAKQMSASRDGFNVGFPTGQPGAVHARYIGEMTLRHINRQQRRKGYRERVNAWAEQSRIPDRSGSLGGLSGGAVLDQQGQVIGIVQAEAARRGRIMTARPATIADMFRRANITYPSSAEPATGLNLDKDGYPGTARDLIKSVRVAKVFCLVD
jgi:serine protease Do